MSAELSRREALKGVAMLAVAEKFADGGLAPVTPVGESEREYPVLPPGALDTEKFLRKCIACGLCASACVEGVIRLSEDWRRFGKPELDFRKGKCLLGCTRCAEVCPVKALFPVQKELKAIIHIGRAVWNKEACLRTTEGEECRACERKCPVEAVHILQGVPVVDEASCIGCGACEHSCPARPRPAIKVEGYKVQRMIRPISSMDLLAEMKRLSRDGFTLVIAKDGVIKERLAARGLRPLYELCTGKPESLAGATVYDKIVGRAAAALYLRAGVKELLAEVISVKAAKMLEEGGVTIAGGKRVEKIINREGTGMCPLEAAVEGIDDNSLMFETIGKTLERIN